MKKLLECKDLSASYDGRKVLGGLSFTVNEGDYLCILGENGSGKSTLVKCLLGIKSPDGGSITMGEGLRQRDIGYLPQHTDLAKGFPATVNEVVLSGCLGKRGLRPFYSRKEKELAAKVMERLGVADLAKKSCRELSGGQQQRMLLARAMCAADKLLLLDEPVTGLDPSAAGDMYRLIKELNEKDGVTIIMVTHDVMRSLDSASRILCLCNCDHSFFGTPEEYANSHFSSKFIGD